MDPCRSDVPRQFVLDALWIGAGGIVVRWLYLFLQTRYGILQGSFFSGDSAL